MALSEPPRYAAAGRRKELERAFMIVLGLEGLESFHEMVRAHEAGELPPLVAWGACPMIFDPAQAPAGKHTAFLWQKVPYALRGDPQSWEAEKERHGRRLLDEWARFAPNLGGRAVLDSFVQTPLDTERSLPNMVRGDLLVGSFECGQVGRGRPFPGAGGYGTPVGGLYLCGASTHPGGNITGLSGHNAARVIAEDLGLEPWWNAPDIEETLARGARE